MFVVIGTTGEYSDRSEWLVCIYADEAMARAHAEAATREAARLFEGSTHYLDVEIDDEAKRWDENMRGDYTGTSYFVQEAPLRDELPI